MNYDLIVIGGGPAGYVGAIRAGRDILEALIFPSASFVPGYEPMRVETKDDVISGNIVREDSSAVVVKLNAALEQRILNSSRFEQALKPHAEHRNLTAAEHDWLRHVAGLQGRVEHQGRVLPQLLRAGAAPARY